MCVTLLYTYTSMLIFVTCLPPVPVDHRLVFTLPKQFILSADDECSFNDEQHFRVEFRFSNGAVANLCPNPEGRVHLRRRLRRNNTAAASQFRKEGEGGAAGEGDDGSGTLLVSDGNRIHIRFSTAEDARRLYSAFPEENPQSLLPVELHFKTGKRAAKKGWSNLFTKLAG